MDKPVLDATCGSRMIWFNKNNEFAVFVDKRELDDEAIWTSGDGKVTRYCNIHPDIIATSHASRLKIRKTGKCISAMSLSPLTISIIQKLQKF